MLEKLKIKYPELKVAGSRNGYFRPEEEQNIVESIRTKNPDMLFIALPIRKKNCLLKIINNSLVPVLHLVLAALSMCRLKK
jgi:N-acetylglucosaminyldiphosphoundecaprenol N-acetyl-beta-D-mannosaminyltransferase